MSFVLDSAARRRLGYKLVDCIDEYFSTLPDRSVQLPLEVRVFDDLKDSLPEIVKEAGKVPR
jgi:hypothetical protein